MTLPSPSRPLVPEELHRNGQEPAMVEKLAEDLSEIKCLLKDILHQRVFTEPNDHSMNADSDKTRQAPDLLPTDKSLFNPEVLRQMTLDQLPSAQLLELLRNHFIAILGIRDFVPAEKHDLYFNRNGDGRRTFFSPRRVDEGRVTVRIVLSDEPSTGSGKHEILEAPLMNIDRIPEADSIGDLDRRIKKIAPLIKGNWPTTLGRLAPSEDDVAEKLEPGDPQYLSKNKVFLWNIVSSNDCSERSDFKVGDYLVMRTDLGYGAEGFLQPVRDMNILQSSKWDQRVNDPEVVCYNIAKHNEGLPLQKHSQIERLPWKGYVFGHVWRFISASTPPQMIPFSLLALAQSQTRYTFKENGRTDMEFLRFMEALQAYCGPWKESGVFWSFDFNHEHWSVFHFVLRWFGTGSNADHSPELGAGIRCDREAGSFETTDGKSLNFRERRIWLSFKVGSNATKKLADDPTPFSTHVPQCTGFIFADTWIPEPLEPVWKSSGLVSYREGSALALYQLYVWRAIMKWENEWNRSLDQFDEMLRVKLIDLTSPHITERLMFDSSFERSKAYFTFLQLLRIFADAIGDTNGGVDDMVKSWRTVHDNTKYQKKEAWSYRFGEDTQRVIYSNWDIILTCHQTAMKRLLDRVGKKKDEVQSIRDGLFNATSLREASRGLALNQYILVFTVLTIFYLPLTFVPSLFSLDMFLVDDETKNRASFYITIVLASFLTYVVSGYFLWTISPLDDRFRFLEWLKSLFPH